jgi:hypothetical protein
LAWSTTALSVSSGTPAKLGAVALNPALNASLISSASLIPGRASCSTWWNVVVAGGMPEPPASGPGPGELLLQAVVTISASVAAPRNT